MNQFYELWGSEIHKELNQLKSIDRARKAATTPTSIDHEKMIGVFPGRTKPYHVSLSSCPCGSFISRRKPCKHMYRLAMECNLFISEFETGVNKNLLPSQVTFEQAVAEIENLSDVCQKLLMDKLRLKDHFGFVERLDDYVQFSFCSLVTEVSPTYEAITKAYTKKRILEICERHNICAPAELSKKNLIEWCIENTPNLFFSIEFKPCFQKKQRIVYRYLKRKYDNDIIVDPLTWQEYFLPFGAERKQNSDLYYFPEDEITDMLNRYGQNRCLNGFDLWEHPVSDAE